MNKEFVTLTIIVVGLFIGAFSYTNLLHKEIIGALNGIKSTYFDAVEHIQNSIDKHFYQASTIEKLKAQLVQYKQDRLLLESIANEYNLLLAANESKLKQRTNIILARAISYAKFGDRNKMWLEIPDFDPNKMYGLVVNGNSAGIVISRLGKPLALLNPDLKMSYAVYIGDNEVPGIARGKNSEEMIVEFIPTWMKINIGDEVRTSGLDNLFHKGIPTGKVIDISKIQGYQIATIKPYANTQSLGYFHVIEQLD